MGRNPGFVMLGQELTDTVEKVESGGAQKNQRNEFVAFACPKLPLYFD